METYHKSVLEYRDVKSAIKYAGKENFAKGLERGREEGMQRGIEKEKFEIAKNLLFLNMSIDDIAVATGLTAEQIKALR